MVDIDQIILFLRDLVVPLFSGFVGAWLLIHLKEKTSYKKAYRAFFHEVKQNISHALQNIDVIENRKDRKGLVTYRDDIWIWSKKTGYFTKFSKDIQNRLFDLYLRQYVIGEFIVSARDRVGGGVFRDKILKETKDELLPLLKQAEKEFESKMDC